MLMFAAILCVSLMFIGVIVTVGIIGAHLVREGGEDSSDPFPTVFPTTFPEPSPSFPPPDSCRPISDNGTQLDCPLFFQSCAFQDKLPARPPSSLFLHSDFIVGDPLQERILSTRTSCYDQGCISTVGTNQDQVGHPMNELVFSLSGLTGTYNSSLVNTTATVWLTPSSVTTCGLGAQIQIWYYFRGGSTPDRTETFAYYPLDCVVYPQKYNPTGVCFPEGGTGVCYTGSEYEPFQQGMIKVLFWSALPREPGSEVVLRANGDVGDCFVSYLTLPYSDLVGA